ncbi:MAG: PKD domain-containing protein [Ferruginibacter sp.]
MKVIILLLFPFFGNAQIKPLQYQWTKISGPAQFKIQSPRSAHTEITNLVAGTYQFELKVTNSNSLSARDTMIVTVKPPINKNFYTALHT